MTGGAAVTSELETSSGTARVQVAAPSGPVGVLLLGHGAGGGVDAPDLLAVRDAVLARGVAVVLVEQPYRYAGHRVPPPATTLDAAWTSVVAQLAEHEDLRGLPQVVGGRSSGARVACRTALTSRAAGVLALAFPLHPPGHPQKSRLVELTGCPGPCLVVQGERDPFGRAQEVAEAAPGVQVLPVPGADHGLKKGVDLDAVAGFVHACCTVS